MSIKAISLGALSMMGASFVILFLIGITDEIGGTNITWFLIQHPSTIYVINVISGFIGGLVTYKLSKERVFANLIAMSSIVFLISLLINYIQAQSQGVSVKSAFGPLIIGCLAPFIFLFFKKHETEKTTSQSTINIEYNQAQRSRPNKVSLAIKLLYVSLGISVLIFIIDPSSLSHIEQRDLELFVGIIALFTFALIWFFIYMIGKGRNWARIILLVTFIIGILFGIPILLQSLVEKPISGLLTIGQSVLQGIALVFLFQKPSSEWFRKM